MTVVPWPWDQNYPGLGIDTIAMTMPVVDVEMHADWRSYLAGYERSLGNWLADRQVDDDARFSFAPQHRILQHYRSLMLGDCKVRLKLSETPFFREVHHPLTEPPFCWTMGVEFEVPKLLDGGLHPCPPDRAADLTLGLLLWLQNAGHFELWCPHNGYFPDDGDWQEANRARCPGPWCQLEHVRVSRADVALDYQVEDHRRYSALMFATPQVRLVDKGIDKFGGVWATSGPAGWYVGWYDRHRQTKGRVPKGTARSEVSARGKKLRTYGIRHPSDLATGRIKEMYDDGIRWSGLRMRSGGDAPLPDRLPALRVSDLRKARLQELVERGFAGVSPNTARTYRRMTRHLCVHPGLPDLGIGGPVRRLSPRTGDESCVDARWDEEGMWWTVSDDDC